MVAKNVGDITAEQLDKMVEDGSVVLVEVMRGQWELKIGKKAIGEVNTDQLTGEQIVSVGGRELGRFTNR